jgi:hypothetical protein
VQRHICVFDAFCPTLTPTLAIRSCACFAAATVNFGFVCVCECAESFVVMISDEEVSQDEDKPRGSIQEKPIGFLNKYREFLAGGNGPSRRMASPATCKGHCRNCPKSMRGWGWDVLSSCIPKVVHSTTCCHGCAQSCCVVDHVSCAPR